jgi:hypothetical protein
MRALLEQICRFRIFKCPDACDESTHPFKGVPIEAKCDCTGGQFIYAITNHPAPNNLYSPQARQVT